MRRTILGSLAGVLVTALVIGIPSAAPATAAEALSSLAPVNGFRELVPIAVGDSGPAVIRLQYGLKRAGFYRGPVDGEFGTTTATAVIAFHKYVDVDRTSRFGALDWIRLQLMEPPRLPYRWDKPSRVEIDLTRQLIFVVEGHRLIGIFPSSTGSGETYYSVRNRREVTATTPAGIFSLRWHETGWNCDRVTAWCVYNYWSFTPYYGIHGYGAVPTHPASHGCARLHTWDSDWLETHLYLGMPVHIWHEVPEVAPPPAQPLITMS